jgi:uncharacterized oligopeptide transporter (OPT) family protein
LIFQVFYKAGCHFIWQPVFFISSPIQFYFYMSNQPFHPFIPDEARIPEFTLKSILMGALFGVIFGASTVYLALKAGLTVSASIPIAVIAITLGRRFLKTTILENNIIQTTGSAGESIAAGVVFTLPGFFVFKRSRKQGIF